MRRMYSEKELSVLVYQAVGQYIEDGAFDEITAESVDAYLEEHPVDITALEGQDIAPKDISATGNITAPSIIENMSGYSYVSSSSYFTAVYLGVCKNGNKLTFAVFGSFSPTADLDSNTQITLATINIPSAIGEKLYPYSQGGLTNVLDARGNSAYSGLSAKVNTDCYTLKNSGTQLSLVARASSGQTLLNGTTYLVRYEVTFLLSENLIGA